MKPDEIIVTGNIQLNVWYKFESKHDRQAWLHFAKKAVGPETVTEIQRGTFNNCALLRLSANYRRINYRTNYRGDERDDINLGMTPVFYSPPYASATDDSLVQPKLKDAKEGQQMPNVSVSVSTDIEITSNASSTIKELIIAARKKEQQASYDLRDHNIQGIIKANSDVSAINKYMKDIENLLGKFKFTIEVVFDQQEVLDMHLTDKDRARIEDEQAAHRARLEAIQDKYKELNALLSITETYDQKINLLKTYNIIAK